MTTITINDCKANQHVLSVQSPKGYPIRFGVGHIAEGEEGRQYYQGPMVPGPWAYTFECCGVIDCNGGTGAERRRKLAEGTEHDVQDGDVVVVDGCEYVAKVTQRGPRTNLELVGR